MVKKELLNENVELLNPYFQGYIIENLEETDESEEFDRSIVIIQEQIHNFN